MYTVSKSARLAEFVEILADERVAPGAKFAAFADVLRVRKGVAARTEAPTRTRPAVDPLEWSR